MFFGQVREFGSGNPGGVRGADCAIRQAEAGAGIESFTSPVLLRPISDLARTSKISTSRLAACSRHYNYLSFRRALNPVVAILNAKIQELLIRHVGDD